MGYLLLCLLWAHSPGATPASPKAGPPVPLADDPALNLGWYTINPTGAVCDKAGPYLLSGSISQTPIGILDTDAYCIIAGFWSSECGVRFANPSRGEVVISSQKPRTFRLYPNSPNPFRQVTRIAYDLPVRSRVLLGIYDVNGRQVRELADCWQDAGRYSLKWDGRDAKGRFCPSGVYFCSVSTEDHDAVRKLTIAE